MGKIILWLINCLCVFYELPTHLKHYPMDDIGLISDTIQDGMNNKASIVMHINDEPFSENNGFELALYYLLEE